MIGKAIVGACLLLSSAAVSGDELSPIVPFVIPSGRPSEGEVRAVVRTLKEHGIDQFMPYPSTGLEYEYLGEEFFAMIGQFLDEAERLGMKVWLYDEFNWPSGTARGRVPAENEKWTYSELVASTNAAGDFSWQRIVSRGRNVDNYCLDGNNFEPDGVQRFMDLTHRAYERRFRRYFGGAIRGIFTDEPGHCSSAATLAMPAGRVLRMPYWTGMEDEYRQASGGRDFRADCERIIRERTWESSDVFRIWTQIRSARYRKSYFDPIADWATRNGIVSTGHLLCEEWPSECARINGLPLHTLQGLTKPGIDLITTNVSSNYQWITFALAQSAAARRGCFGSAELFGLGPCDLTFAMMRRQYWLCALHRIDTFFQGLHHMTAVRFAVKDSWAMFTSPTQPWYDEIGLLNRTAKAAARWARKPFACPVAIVYPQRQAGSNRIVGGPDPSRFLRDVSAALSWNGFTYELVEEDEPAAHAVVVEWTPTGVVERRSGHRFSGLGEIVPWLAQKLGRAATPGVVERNYADGTRVRIGVEKGEVVLERPLTNGWTLAVSAPTRRRTWFRKDDNTARVSLAEPLMGVRVVLRDLPAGSLRVTLDGRPLAFPRRASSLVYAFNEICRETDPLELSAGEHVFRLEGGRDGKMFYPAMWLVGDFVEREANRLEPRPSRIGCGALAAQGLADFAGTATYSAETRFARGSRLAVEAGGAVVRVRLGGRDLGARGWAPFEWRVPDDLAERPLGLEISVTTSARPVFGSARHPDAQLDHGLWIPSSLADPSPVGLLSVREVFAEEVFN